jgi:hypothetical protein
LQRPPARKRPDAHVKAVAHRGLLAEELGLCIHRAARGARGQSPFGKGRV